jgi:hypothetical protein
VGSTAISGSRSSGAASRFDSRGVGRSGEVPRERGSRPGMFNTQKSAPHFDSRHTDSDAGILENLDIKTAHFDSRHTDSDAGILDLHSISISATRSVCSNFHILNSIVNT